LPAIGDTIEIGVVARAHGIRGEVRVHLYNPASTVLDQARSVLVGDRAYDIESARPVAGAYLLALAGVEDRNAAEVLRGRPVAVARADLELDEGEVLLADLVGCKVELPDGSDWGVVSALDLGRQDRLVIRQGDVERLLPVVDAFVIEIDVEGRRIVVDPPAELPEDKARP
jgi:16S rRNA processing protein RimM